MESAVAEVGASNRVVSGSGSSGRGAEADAAAMLAAHGEAVGKWLGSLKGRYRDAPPRLLEAIEYSLLAGGKRLRPALVLESARACGADPHQPSILAAAGAVELIHTFSLVHDDLPAMDDDDLRRGRPTNHKVFGEAMAILAGDSMVAMAFEAVAADSEPAIVAPLVAELARATGPIGMIGGQTLDMEGEGTTLDLHALRRLHRMKTGALLVASCRLGAIAARATPEKVQHLDAFGRRLGLVFQIVDDLLDVTATSEQMGKATGKDAAKGKNTYPRLMGVDASRREAADQLSLAMAALEPLGFPADGLRALARFVVERTT